MAKSACGRVLWMLSASYGKSRDAVYRRVSWLVCRGCLVGLRGEAGGRG